MKRSTCSPSRARLVEPRRTHDRGSTSEMSPDPWDSPIASSRSSRQQARIHRHAHGPRGAMRAVASELRDAGWPVVLSAATTLAVPLKRSGDEYRIRRSTGQTTLPELAAVVQSASAVVGGDSFIGHLASSLNRPVVSIFGPSNSAAWKPYGSLDINEPHEESATGLVVRYPLPCEPCIYTGYSLGRPAGCPSRTCLTMVTEDMVVAATLRVLEADQTWETEK